MHLKRQVHYCRFFDPMDKEVEELTTTDVGTLDNPEKAILQMQKVDLRDTMKANDFRIDKLLASNAKLQDMPSVNISSTEFVDNTLNSLDNGRIQ